MKNDSNTVETLNKMFAKRLKPILKPVYCVDGANLSVQASREHYCWPRNNEGPYTNVEVAWPSIAPPAMWAKYCVADSEGNPCDSVYANVPVELVAEYVDMHGGIKPAPAPLFIVPPPPAAPSRPRAIYGRPTLTVEDMMGWA